VARSNDPSHTIEVTSESKVQILWLNRSKLAAAVLADVPGAATEELEGT
jgi:hypothetical protein